MAEEAQHALYRTASLLDAVLFNRNASQHDVLRAGSRRILFMTHPPDLRLWSAGDDITLVCFTDNQPQTFWSFVAEKTNDELLESKARQWRYATRAADAFEGVQVGMLPRGGCINLQYCRMPPHLDVALISEYGIPEYGTDTAGFGSELRRHAVSAALEQCKQLTNEGVERYLMLRRDAEARGLFSRDFGILSPNSGYPIEAAGMSKALDADRAFKAILLARAMSGNGSSSEELYTAAEEYEMLFMRSYPRYLVLKCRCWSTAGTQNAWPHLVRATKALLACLSGDEVAVCDEPYVRELALSLRDAPQSADSVSFQTGLQLWPRPFRIPTKDESETLWAVLVGLDEQESRAVAGVRKQDAQASAGVEDVYIEEQAGRLLSVAVLLQNAVQEYQPVHSADMIAKESSTTLERSDTADAASKRRFRDAGAVLSRLRWDPKLMYDKHEVGYLDRFDGIIWLPLESWGRPTEEEDFIPEHRIRQFRRVQDGQIVWDRDERIDLTD